MNHKIALIISLDTKLAEAEFASRLIREAGDTPVLIDISTFTVLEGKSDVSPMDILKRSGVSWGDFSKLEKGESITVMCGALEKAMPQLYAEGVFEGIFSVGGGQNGKMATAAMRALPFGVPKLLVSALACGKRTIGQFVGDKDIMLMNSIADISGLNPITCTVISNACHAVCGMAGYMGKYEKNPNKKTVAVTLMGITSKGAEQAMKLLEERGCETIGFHANGVGGTSMEKLIDEDYFDVILDMTLHEITCEFYGGYCSGAVNRLLKAAGKGIPMVVAPGAIDMIDYYVDENGNGLPENFSKRKHVFHNSSTVHTKISPEEAINLAKVIAERLNTATAPVTVVLPLKGFCAPAVEGKPMYDPETDKEFVKTLKQHLTKKIKVVEAELNCNQPEFSQLVADEVRAVM